MQTRSIEMCRFLYGNRGSAQDDAELYNAFLMQTQNGTGTGTVQNADSGEQCWCRYEEFIRLRKLPDDVLRFLGGA